MYSTFIVKFCCTSVTKNAKHKKKNLYEIKGFVKELLGLN